MPGYTRQQLKQDRFAETAKETVSWAVEHRNKLIVAGVVAVVVLAVAAGGWFYLNHQDELASAQLGKALRIYETPLRPPGVPAQPEMLNFASAQERAAAAQKEFLQLVNQYGHTKSADFARYFIGLTDRDLGKNQEAEKALEQVASSGNKELAALARFALAAVYRDTGRDADAIKIYQELTAHPTLSVPKDTAQLELASLYQEKQPAEAARIYEQIRKEGPQSEAAQIAAARLAAQKQNQ